MTWYKMEDIKMILDESTHSVNSGSLEASLPGSILFEKGHANLRPFWVLPTVRAFP